MIWAGTVALAGCGALWLWVTARHMVRATEGVPVPARPGTALVLVELQEAFWNDAHHGAPDRHRVEAAVAREAELARHRDQPVIALRQEWSGLATRLIARATRPGAPLRGGAGVGLAAPFHGLADHVVVKRVEDGFETGELDAVLGALHVGRLRLMGRDGCAGLARTAQAALNRGYEVELVRDGIAASDVATFAAMRDALLSQGARVV